LKLAPFIRVCKEKKLEKIIKNLINLQDCDFHLKDIIRRKAEGPARIHAFENDLKLVESQTDEDQSKVDSIKRERRQLEQDIEDLESRTEKSREKLANIKSNKEYGAALKEIEDLEREKTHAEDRVIEIMEEAEVLEAKCAASKEKREEYRKKFEQDQKVVEKELEVLGRELENHEKERARIRKEIDEALLKKYDYIGEHKEGIAVSSVIKGVCQACHLGIPPQKFNELMRGDVLMNCPHCMRIIYWGEDERYVEKV
jgi:predicted  nucleic acid-binding Zn-ribbon protein